MKPPDRGVGLRPRFSGATRSETPQRAPTDAGRCLDLEIVEPEPLPDVGNCGFHRWRAGNCRRPLGGRVVPDAVRIGWEGLADDTGQPRTASDLDHGGEAHRHRTWLPAARKQGPEEERMRGRA